MQRLALLPLVGEGGDHEPVHVKARAKLEQRIFLERVLSLPVREPKREDREDLADEIAEL